ncbi:MAG: lytic murein transglycosylase B [Steroidobacteraceae bacterium]
MRRGIRGRIAALLVGCCASLPSAALDTGRADVSAFIDGVVARNRLDRGWVQRIVAAAESQQAIIDLMQRPAERVRPWFRYRDHFLTAERIDAGVAFWTEHRARLAEIAGTTGVAPHVIVGILGVETFFGRITGRYRVLDALATLGFDYPPRGEYFRGELEQFLLLARRNGIDPLAVRGSYAGAMGLPQFMPRSYLSYAVDGDLDGRSDLWGSVDDVMSSVANYLAKHGWQAGAPIVLPATLVDPDAEGLVVGSLTTNRSVGELRRLGLMFDPALGDDVPALLVGVRGTDGPEYRVGLRNLAVIMRYNRSPMYALAVHELGSRIEAALPPPAPVSEAATPADAPRGPATPADPAAAPARAAPAAPTARNGAPL